MVEQKGERRQFQRILFDAVCEIHGQDQIWKSELLDISLKGVLICRPASWPADLEGPFDVVVQLSGAANVIEMKAELRHVETDTLGFHCHAIDLTSASHLKRLIELNLGDQALLERELSHLVGPQE
ncbi:MAG: PilZ domain-containing protein [Oleiphilaceae bacterium]|nr:PilZ domain-containing protein [Oleiphilaceae bacterium]